MDFAGAYRAESLHKLKHPRSARVGLNSDTLLEIKLPDSKILRVLSRSLLLTLVILTLPSIGSIFREPSGSFLYIDDDNLDSDYVSSKLDLLWQDFYNEGLIKKGHKALILSSGVEHVIGAFRFLNESEIDVVLESDLQRQKSFLDEEFDFVFLADSVDSDFSDRVVKTGGVLSMPVSNGISSSYQKHSNYRIVYLRRYSSTIVAMRKTGPSKQSVDSTAKRRLCQLARYAKKAALEGLEDVLLEPPRKALAKAHMYRKKIKFLPDLLGDSLERYPRRIFINVGLPEERNVVAKWFNENYPKRNQDFEVFSLEMMMFPGEEASSEGTGVDVSDWLMQNVREEEYVVMKAETEVVEEMIKRRTIFLVDELFLECSNQWQAEGKKKSERAYWECLALYGRLRDEGVAVHQWWG